MIRLSTSSRYRTVKWLFSSLCWCLQMLIHFNLSAHKQGFSCFKIAKTHIYHHLFTSNPVSKPQNYLWQAHISCDFYGIFIPLRPFSERQNGDRLLKSHRLFRAQAIFSFLVSKKGPFLWYIILGIWACYDAYYFRGCTLHNLVSIKRSFEWYMLATTRAITGIKQIQTEYDLRY